MARGAATGPRRGAIGGSNNELGSEYRARVGALLATTVVSQSPLSLERLELSALGDALAIRAESDDPVDDLVVEMVGGQVLVQAKRSVELRARGGPFAAALSQFADAVKCPSSSDAHLVLAYGSGSVAIADMAHALDRRRSGALAGAATADESKALERLRKAARPLLDDDHQLDDLLDRLHLWHTDPTTGDGAGMLSARLEASVCPSGQGEQAALALTDVVREIARLRSGRDAIGLVQALHARGVELSTELGRADATLSAAALDRYCQRIIAQGQSLSLFGRMPNSLAALPLGEADADILVDRPGDDRSTGHALGPSLRRRGRALLVGDAGGGKSTALRALAADWAQRPNWPLPLTLRLRRASAPCPSLSEQLISAALGETVGEDRRWLRVGLERSLSRGECLVLLDGLDEIRVNRFDLLEALKGWLGELHPDTELLISTRPVSADDAVPFDLPALDLRRPAHPMTSVDAILNAVANADGHDDHWVTARRQWVRDAIVRDPTLGATPLSVVSLAVLAATAARPTDLPAHRAGVLRQLLTDAFERRDIITRHGDNSPVEGLGPKAGSRALERALQSVAAPLLLERPTREQALVLVAGELAKVTDLHGLQAEGAADDALRFWEELGVLGEEDGHLAARVRPLVEVAHGSLIATAPAVTLAEDVQSARSQPALWEALSLAAGLSTEVADRWVQAVAAPGTSADELIALLDARADGARFTPAHLDLLAAGSALALLQSGDDSERVAEALLTVDWSDDTLRVLRPAFAADVPEERRLLVQALTTLTLDAPEQQDQELLRRVVQGPAPPHPEPWEETDRELTALDYLLRDHDDLYERVRERAALAVVASSRQDAEAVLGVFAEHGSLAFREQLERRLRDAGLQDLADASRLPGSTWLAHYDPVETDAHHRQTLEQLASVGKPLELTWLQSRRLDEISDLYACALLSWTWPNWSSSRRGGMASWIRAVAVLGGFERGVVAAQAQQVLDEMDQDNGAAFGLLSDAGAPRTLDRWDLVEEPDVLLRELIVSLRFIPQQAAGRWLRALLRAPDRALVAARLEQLRPRATVWARQLVGLGVLLASGSAGEEVADGLLLSDEPFDRAAVAEWASIRARPPRPLPTALQACADDSDANVRVACLEHWPGVELDQEKTTFLERLRALPLTGWRCGRCGTDNPAPTRDHLGCSKCQTSPPDVRRRIDDLLDPPSAPALPDTIAPKRRIRSTADPFYAGTSLA